MNWKVIDSYPDYAINKEGQIKRLTSRTNGKEGKLKKHTIDDGGYPIVSLWHKNKGRNQRVHALLMRAFIGNPPNGYETNHKDGNTRNFHLSNLEYVTHQGNSLHAANIGLILSGKHHHNYSISSRTVANMRRLYKNGMRISRLARMFHRPDGTISYIVRGIRRRHDGNGPQSPTQPVSTAKHG